MEPAQAAGIGGGGGPDRLSALPDCLLHVIISSLKARQVVQTCVLSRRWRDLWRSVPCVDIDLDEFRTETAEPAFDNHKIGSGGGGRGGGVGSSDSSDGSSDSEDGSSDSEDGSSGSDMNSSDSENDDNSGSDVNSSDSENDDDDSDSDLDSSDSSSSSDDDDDGNKAEQWEKFEDFTANLMLRCNIAQLDSFRLHIRRRMAPRIGSTQAAGWLRRAMKYCAPDPASQRIRKGLGSGSWRLKRLHLCHVPLDNRFTEHVDSVCLSLEDLELDDCSCGFQSVTSHSLKTLVLKNCTWRNLSEITAPTLKTLVIDGGSNTDGCVLVILTPAVAYLNLDVRVDCFPGGISINEMPSLAKASIHLRGHKNNVFESKLCGDQFKLLRSVSNATSLELSGVGKTVLGKEPTFQEFRNLKNLLMGNCDFGNFRTLGFFLQSSPNLEMLTLRHCKFPAYSKEKKRTPHLNMAFPEFYNLYCKDLKVEIIHKSVGPRQPATSGTLQGIMALYILYKHTGVK